MKTDVKDLLGSVQAIRSPGVRIGLPDDATPLDIADPRLLSAALDDALRAFHDLRNGADYLVSAEVNAYHRAVWVRFVQRGPSQDCDGQVEPALEPVFRALRAEATKSGGDLCYWGGNNYFDVSLPFRGRVREAFPEVEHLPWEARYRYLLERATWESLRGMAFRSSNLAESFAALCVEFRMSRVLIPSVGLCVHPWLFADRGLSVVATDAAGLALATLAGPDRWPRLYSRAAFERWDIAQSASYATQGNPDHFERMPDLEDVGVRKSLCRRITFALSDWADLPLEGGSVDALFATNALPRESSGERSRVLKEWVRVVRPGGVVFIAQHNFFDADVEPVLRSAGWVEADILGRERPAQPGVTGFQVHHSSG
ncbi:MAG: methyltransferase domain-containing protein [Gemmataceae bacterium]